GLVDGGAGRDRTDEVADETGAFTCAWPISLGTPREATAMIRIATADRATSTGFLSQNLPGRSASSGSVFAPGCFRARISVSRVPKSSEPVFQLARSWLQTLQDVLCSATCAQLCSASSGCSADSGSASSERTGHLIVLRLVRATAIDRASNRDRAD